MHLTVEGMVPDVAGDRYLILENHLLRIRPIGDGN
jgi:hypothetical protein